MTQESETRELSRLGSVLEQVLEMARAQGASAAEADVGTGNGLSVCVRRGEVESVEHQRDKGLGLTVYLGKRKGNASTTDFSAAALRETVTAACTIARNASEDPCAGLLDKQLLAEHVPDLDLYHLWPISPDQAISIATECERMALATDARICNSDGTIVHTYSGTHTYANSHGFTGGWNWSSHTLDCTVIAEAGGGMQRDGWYTKARDPADLDDAAQVARLAGQRTAARLGARQLSTRRVPVIFEAPVAANLFSTFVSAISGSALYRKASFLLDRLGQQVFADHVQIREEPHLRKGLGSAPFDNDGMATRARQLVRDGVLQGYLLSAYSARKLGLQPTGNAGGVHNLLVTPGDHDLPGLLRAMDKGFLVTDLIGFGVNQVTGDYSRGAAGFWVEGGEIRYPVEEITIAGNLLDMYRQILAIGNDVDQRGNIRTGSVLIEAMTLAGN